MSNAIDYRSFAHKDSHESQINTIHNPFIAEDVRPGVPISASISAMDTDSQYFKFDLPVWRMSPLGIELIKPPNIPDLAKGKELNLELRIANQETFFQGLVVDSTFEHQNMKIIAIRLVKQVEETKGDADRRSARRWLCGEHFYPTGVAANPLSYNDFIYFRIRDISANGLQMITSLRNKFIVAGMKFECVMDFPMISQVQLKFVVKNVRIAKQNGQDFLAVGAALEGVTPYLKEVIGQYLIQFGNVDSLKELQNEALHPKSVAKAVTYRYVKTKEDYQKVLEFRHFTYSKAGKIPEQSEATLMADESDARSRIVMGEYNGQIVCTSRLVFNNPEDQMEHDPYVKWPDHLPRKEEMVEINRTATHPDFRSSDLLMGMFRFIAIAVVQSKRKWIVLGSTPELASLYKKMGFKYTNLNYTNTLLHELFHEIYLGNVPEGLSGKGVNPIYWNIIWSPVSDFLYQYDLIESDPLVRLRFGFYKLINPIASFYYDSQQRKRTSQLKVKKFGNVEK